MILLVINFVSSLLRIFENPKKRVRKIDGSREVWGTVEKTMRGSAGPGREMFIVDYWTVRWDDEPHFFESFPSYKFQWIDDEYTLKI